LPSVVDSFIIASSLKRAAVKQDETEWRAVALSTFSAIQSSRRLLGVGVPSFNR
jgi:hypothetical protein